MTVYEYRCRECGAQVVSRNREDAGQGHTIFETGEDDPCPGPLKRTWSFGIVWPADQRGHD